MATQPCPYAVPAAKKLRADKMIKAKNFRNPKENPNGKMRDFTLYDGYKLEYKDGWYREKGGVKENDKSL